MDRRAAKETFKHLASLALILVVGVIILLIIGYLVIGTAKAEIGPLFGWFVGMIIFFAIIFGALGFWQLIAGIYSQEKRRLNKSQGRR